MITSEGFRGMSLLPPSCAHTKIRQGFVRILRTVWDRPGRPDQAWLLDAKIAHFRHGFFVDTTDPKTCLHFRDDRAPADEGKIVKGELFSGGFSGWIQIVPFLNEHLAPIRCAFAVDCDLVAATTFAENYGNGVVYKEAKDIALVSQHAFVDATSHQTFMCDIRSGWWCQFAPRVDLMALSPPCPSWSVAHWAYGLVRADGFLTI